MSAFRFENQGGHTYLVYDVTDLKIIDEFVKGMLTNNKIPGIADTVFSQINDKASLHFDVSSMISASQLFTKAVNRNLVLGFFKGIANAYLAVDEYMLDEKMLVWDMDYIFTNVSTGKTDMICLPVNRVDAQETDILAFIKRTLFNLKFDTTEDNNYVSVLMNYVNSHSSIIAEEFQKVLQKLEPSQSGALQAASVPIQQQTPVQQHAPSAVQRSNDLHAAISRQTAAQPQNQLAPQMQKNSVVQQPAQPAVTKSVQNGGYSMAIPGQSTRAVMPAPQPPAKQETSPAVQEDGDQISWLYLMQHYNKENAAKYKAQKAAKKGQKKGKQTASPNPVQPMQQMPIPPMQQVTAPRQMTVPQPVMAGAPAPAEAISRPSVMQPQIQRNVIQQQNQPSSLPVLEQPQGTTVLQSPSFDVGTTVLTAPMAVAEKRPYLIRTKNKERIEIKGEMFRIGRERSFVDYCISDNTAISGCHACIHSRDGKFFLVDTNSTNRTFLQNNVIPSNEEMPLNDGDTIRFANEEYQFKMV